MFSRLRASLGGSWIGPDRTDGDICEEVYEKASLKAEEVYIRGKVESCKVFTFTLLQSRGARKSATSN